MLIVASSTDLNLGEKSQGSCEFLFIEIWARALCVLEWAEEIKQGQ